KDEYDGLRVAGVDDEAAQDQTQRPANRAVLQAHLLHRCVPLTVTEIQQITDTEPLDQRKAQGRGGQQSPDPCSDDGNLHQQGQLQTYGVPVTPGKTVVQATGHGGDGARTGAQADDPAGQQKCQPGVETHVSSGAVP